VGVATLGGMTPWAPVNKQVVGKPRRRRWWGIESAEHSALHCVGAERGVAASEQERGVSCRALQAKAVRR
jgi:hypothetical protein